MKANASKHKAMSYEYMEKRERELREQVEKLLAQAEAADATEDALYGRDQRGDELPKELAFKQSRLKKIQEAKAALGGRGQGARRARARAAAKGRRSAGGGGARSGGAKHRRRFSEVPGAQGATQLLPTPSRGS